MHTIIDDRAKTFVAEIRANVNSWYAQQNTPETYAAFGQRNGAIWERIAASGQEINDEVLRILRTRE